MNRPNYFTTQWPLGLMAALMVIGCTPPVETQVVMTSCSPEAENIYMENPNLPTMSILQYAATSTPDPITGLLPQDQKIQEARYAALKFLEYQVKRWTYVNTQDLDATNSVQITVTFLSPELLQAVFLNNLLAHNPLYTDLNTGLINDMGQVARREELIFLVTVAATNQNHAALSPHILDLDINSLILKNANDYEIPPKHDDHNLDEPINLSGDPIFGFLYYPQAVLVNGVCEHVLNRESNTKINLKAQAVIDSVSSGPYIWTIPYAPLVETGNSFYTPEYPAYPVIFEESSFSPLKTPPTNVNTPDFWREYARFLWGQITLENY